MKRNGRIVIVLAVLATALFIPASASANPLLGAFERATKAVRALSAMPGRVAASSRGSAIKAARPVLKASGTSRAIMSQAASQHLAALPIIDRLPAFLMLGAHKHVPSVAGHTWVSGADLLQHMQRSVPRFRAAVRDGGDLPPSWTQCLSDLARVISDPAEDILKGVLVPFADELVQVRKLERWRRARKLERWRLVSFETDAVKHRVPRAWKKVRRNEKAFIGMGVPGTGAAVSQDGHWDLLRRIRAEGDKVKSGASGSDDGRVVHAGG